MCRSSLCDVSLCLPVLNLLSVPHTLPCDRDIFSFNVCNLKLAITIIANMDRDLLQNLLDKNLVAMKEFIGIS